MCLQSTLTGMQSAHAGSQEHAEGAASGRTAGIRAVAAAGRGTKRPHTPESSTHAALAKKIMLGLRKPAAQTYSAGLQFPVSVQHKEGYTACSGTTACSCVSSVMMP